MRLEKRLEGDGRLEEGTSSLFCPLLEGEIDPRDQQAHGELEAFVEDIYIYK